MAKNVVKEKNKKVGCMDKAIQDPDKKDMNLRGVIKFIQLLRYRNIRLEGLSRLNDVYFEKECILKGFTNARKVEGNLTSNLKVEGRIFAEVLAAEKIVIRIMGAGNNVRIGSVRAGFVKISSDNKKNGEIEINSIITDDVYIEYSFVDKIKARNIEIGPGCIINKIEYAENIMISPFSKVKKCEFVGV